MADWKLCKCCLRTITNIVSITFAFVPFTSVNIHSSDQCSGLSHCPNKCLQCILTWSTWMLLKSGHNYIRGVILKWRRPYHCIRYGCNKTKNIPEQKKKLISKFSKGVKVWVDSCTREQSTASLGKFLIDKKKHLPTFKRSHIFNSIRILLSLSLCVCVRLFFQCKIWSGYLLVYPVPHLSILSSSIFDFRFGIYSPNEVSCRLGKWGWKEKSSFVRLLTSAEDLFKL